MHTLQYSFIGIGNKRPNGASGLFRGVKIDRILCLEQFQNQYRIEVILVIVTDENSVNAIPGCSSFNQCGFYFRRHAIIDTVVVTKQRVERNFGLTALDHDAGIGEVVCTRRLCLGCVPGGPQAAKKQADDTLAHTLIDRLYIKESAKAEDWATPVFALIDACQNKYDLDCLRIELKIRVSDESAKQATT